MIEVQGSPDDLNESGVDFAKLVGLSGESSEVSGEIPDAQTAQKSSVVSLNSDNTSKTKSESIEGNVKQKEKEKEKDEGLQMEETSKGKVKGSIPWNYFKAGAHWSVLIILALSFLLVQLIASGADYWVSVW